MSSMTPEHSSSIADLEAWLVCLGARLTPLAIGYSPDGVRGMYARSRIEAETRLMEIPSRCMLTALGSEALTIALLTARKAAGSFWRPYIATLPSEFPTMPLFFGAEDRELLKGSCTVNMIEHQERTFAAEYRLLREASGEAAPFTYREFLWGRASVLSRGLSLHVRGAPVKVLVPMVDLMNHRIPPETTWGVDDRTGSFRVATNQGVPPGAPLHCSYGLSFNSRLLVNYGFALADNRHDEAQIPRPSIAVPRRMEALLSTLCSIGGGEHGHFRLTRDIASAEPLVSFLRAACADPSEQIRVAGTRVEFAGTRTEIRVLDALRQACVDALGAFDGTLAEDEAQLAGDLTPNQRNAAIVRRGEKQVLYQYVSLAEAVIPVLRLPDQQLGRLLTSPPSSLSCFAPYLRMLRSTAM